MDISSTQDFSPPAPPLAPTDDVNPPGLVPYWSYPTSQRGAFAAGGGAQFQQPAGPYPSYDQLPHPPPFMVAAPPLTPLPLPLDGPALAVQQRHDSPFNQASGEEGPPLKKKRVVKPRPPPAAGVVLTEKSCLRCRVRKVKCDRTFPECGACKIRGEECDLISLHPDNKTSSSARDQADSERIARLEARLAELEGTVVKDEPQLSATSRSSSADYVARGPTLSSPPLYSPTVNQAPVLQSDVLSTTDLGFGSVDARLSKPQLAKSLSAHLCDAFFESCCWLLPSFSYYRENLPAYHDDRMELSSSSKVAIAAFCAIGARASPHSAVLGIEAFPSDARDNPNAPLLSAGTRRQSACAVLVSRAHAQGFEQGLMDEATMESLAALLALVQMVSFTDLVRPRKSRALLRAAVGHYRELQDAATTREEAEEVQRVFGMAIFTLDCQNSAYARRSPLLSDSDLALYFSRSGISVPTLLPEEDLVAQLRSTLVGPGQPRKENLRTALHLLSCWTAACQRLYAGLAAPPHQGDLAQDALHLFNAVDKVRSAIHYVQSLVYKPSAHSHSHAPVDTTHSHENDHLALVTRSDRDLLDLFAMTHTLLIEVMEKAGAVPGKAMGDVTREAERRTRKALKVNALYAKMYTQGADSHMVFHSAMQLELTPNWTRLALAKVGEPYGPATREEELTEAELGWLTEALQIACYYHPSAERRLAELSPRFVAVASAPIPDSPFPSFVKIGKSDPNSTPSAESHTPPPGFSLESYASTSQTQVSKALPYQQPPQHQHEQQLMDSLSAGPALGFPYEDESYTWGGAASGNRGGYILDWSAGYPS